MEKFWVIVNIEGLDESSVHRGAYYIIQEHRPTILHCSREEAEGELARLAAAYPRQDFWLFETVARGTARRFNWQSVGRVDPVS